MPSRAKYVHNAAYASAFEKVFGEEPDTPYLELYIPLKARTPELVQRIMRPVWDMEVAQVWTGVAEQMAKAGVRGDLLEFGVFSGGSLRRLIDIFAPKNIVGKFYGFDSFKGLPKPSEKLDIQCWHEGEFANASREQVHRHLSANSAGATNFELVEGWFNETLPKYRDAIADIAFVRVDCDLYQSTVDALAFLDNRLVDGAVIYFDDWTHDAETGETRAFFEFAERTASRYRFERLVTCSDGAFAVRVGKR